MIEVVWDESFKKRYKKRIASNGELKEKFWEALELFGDNPRNSQLKTHKLTGKLSGLWAFTVSYDCRIVFRFVSHTEVLLIDVGGHDEVY